MQQRTPKESGPRRAYDINEAAAAFGLSRTTLYKLIGVGTLRSVKIGGRRLNSRRCDRGPPGRRRPVSRSSETQPSAPPRDQHLTSPDGSLFCIRRRSRGRCDLGQGRSTAFVYSQECDGQDRRIPVACEGTGQKGNAPDVVEGVLGRETPENVGWAVEWIDRVGGQPSDRGSPCRPLRPDGSAPRGRPRCRDRPRSRTSKPDVSPLSL